MSIPLSWDPSDWDLAPIFLLAQVAHATYRNESLARKILTQIFKKESRVIYGW